MKLNAKQIELYGLIILSIITLVALLAYTFVHTGGLLSEYVKPGFIGYVAAFGVEAAIITMSIRIGKLLRSLAQSHYKGLEGWLSLAWQGTTLLFVLAVSAAANIVEGHKVKYGLELTLSTIQDLDSLQILIGLLATGLIPVVVLSMTEIVSGEIKSALQVDVPALQPDTQEEDAIDAIMQPVKVEQPALQPALQNLIADLQPEAMPIAEEASDFWGDMEDMEEPELDEQPALQSEPVLDDLLAHFGKSREQVIAMLKQYGMWNKPAEQVYSQVKRYVGLPEDITSEVFARLFAELKGDTQADLQPAPAPMQTHLQQKPDGVSDEAWRAYQLASEGLSQADIASHLGKSVATVSRYLAKVKASEVTA